MVERCVELRESHAVHCQLVDVRRLVKLGSIDPGVLPTKIVHKDQNKMERLILGLSLALSCTPCQKRNDCKRKEHHPGTSEHRQQYAAFVLTCGSKDPSQCRSSFDSSLAVDPSLLVRSTPLVLTSRSVGRTCQTINVMMSADRGRLMLQEVGLWTLGNENSGWEWWEVDRAPLSEASTGWRPL